MSEDWAGAIGGGDDEQEDWAGAIGGEPEPQSVRNEAIPALTYSGISYAEDALARKQVDAGTLIANTRSELHRIFGPQNVRPVVAKGNRWIDFEVRDKGAKEWRSSGAKDYFNQIVQAEQKKLIESTNTSQGAPAGTRLGAYIKVSPEGMRSYLAEKYGEENVHQVRAPDGTPTRQFVIRETPTSRPIVFDPDNMPQFLGGDPDVSTNFGEFVKDATVDNVGDIIESIPGVVAGVAAARFGPGAAQTAAAAGDVIGSGARQAISHALPGDDQLGLADRFGSAVSNVGAGMTGEAIGRAGSAAWDAVNPAQWAMRAKQRQIRGEFVPEAGDTAGAIAAAQQTPGRRVMQAIGLEQRPAALANVATGAERIERNAPIFERVGVRNPTPGMLTGSSDQIRFEAGLRQVLGTGDIWNAADLERELNVAKHVDKIIAASGKNVGAEQAGKAFAGAGENYIGTLVKGRREKVGKLFEEIDKESGNQRIVPVNNLLRELDALIEDGDRIVSLGGNEFVAQDLLRKKQKILERAGERTKGGALRKRQTDVRFTMTELQNALHDFGEASRGSGSLIKDLDKQADKRIARRLRAALEKDLDEAADRVQGYAEGPVPLRDRGDIPAKLVRARQGWKAWSKVIDNASDGLLDAAAGFNVSGKSQKIAPYLLGKDITDDQLRDSVRRMSKLPEGKEAIGKMRVAVMENLIEKSTAGANTAAGIDEVTRRALGEDVSAAVSMAKVATKLRENRSRLRALYHDDPKALADIDDAIAAAAITANRGGIQGSQTAPLAFIMKSLQEFKSGNVTGGVDAANYAFNAKRLSIALNDPEQRAILLGLQKAPINISPRHKARLASKLWALNERAMRFYYDEGEPQQDDGVRFSQFAANEANR